MKLLIIATLLSTAVATPALAAKILAEPATTPTVPVRVAAAIPPAAIPPAASAPTPAPQVRATPAVTSRSAFYLGGQLGDSTVGALMGYQISKMYSMELSYDYVDPIYTPNTTLAKSRFGLSGLAMFPIKFSEMGPMAIYFKAGYGRTTEKYIVEDPGLGIPAFPATRTETITLKTGVTAGAGVHVDLSNNTSARLGANYVGGDRSIYLAALYKF